MATALIIGHTGQDGFYLSEHLLRKAYHVYGLSRNTWMEPLFTGVARWNVLSPTEVAALIKAVSPDELYYLAAFHHSATEQRPDDHETLTRSLETHVTGFSNCLKAVHRHRPQCKTFYAASSHVYGSPTNKPQNETTPFNPVCLYGITKATGVHVARYYRETHGLYVAVGILYNHESPRRPPRFVSRKIVDGVAAIVSHQTDHLTLGELDAETDWGYAPDYVDAIYRILQIPEPTDFIISSGVLHTVRDFVAIAFGIGGLDYTQYIRVNPSFIQKQTKRNLLGDSDKLRTWTGWAPRTSFKEMVESMTEEALAAYAR